MKPNGAIQIPEDFWKKLKLSKNNTLEAKLLSNGVAFIKTDCNKTKKSQ